jgi:putative cofactor-binding repeat protein
MIMASRIDPDRIADDLPVRKADLREALRAAKDELSHGGFFRSEQLASLVRTVSSKLEERISVKDFGAAGDGSADEATAFSRSLSLRRRLHVPRGIYRWRSLPEAPDLIDLEGDGPDETIIVLDGSQQRSWAITDLSRVAARGITLPGFDTLFHVTGNVADIHLERLRLKEAKCLISTDIDDYNGSGATEEIEIDRLVMRHCELIGGESGISLVCNIKSALVEGNYIHDIQSDKKIFGIRIGLDNNERIPQYQTTGAIIVRDNLIENLISTSGLGEANVNGILADGYDVVISGNIIRNVYGSAYNCEGIYTKASRLVISNNVLFNAGRNQGAITCKGSAANARAAASPDGYFMTVHDNVVWWPDGITDDFPRLGIFIDSEYANIHDNLIRGASKTAIFVDGHNEGSTRNIAVRNNKIIDCSGNGVTASGTFDGLIIEGNEIGDWLGTAAGTLIYIGDSASTVGGPARRYIVRNNVLKSRAEGVVSGTHRAIYFRPTEAPVDDLVIEGNLIDVSAGEGAAVRGINIAPAESGGLRHLILRNNDYGTMTINQISGLEGYPIPTLRIEEAIRYVTVDGGTKNVMSLPLVEGGVAALAVRVLAATPGGGMRQLFDRRALAARTGGAVLVDGTADGSADLAGGSPNPWTTEFMAATGELRIRVRGEAGREVHWMVRLEIDTMATGSAAP